MRLISLSSCAGSAAAGAWTYRPLATNGWSVTSCVSVRAERDRLRQIADALDDQRRSLVDAIERVRAVRIRLRDDRARRDRHTGDRLPVRVTHGAGDDIRAEREIHRRLPRDGVRAAADIRGIDDQTRTIGHAAEPVAAIAVRRAGDPLLVAGNDRLDLRVRERLAEQRDPARHPGGPEGERRRFGRRPGQIDLPRVVLAVGGEERHALRRPCAHAPRRAHWC